MHITTTDKTAKVRNLSKEKNQKIIQTCLLIQTFTRWFLMKIKTWQLMRMLWYKALIPITIYRAILMRSKKVNRKLKRAIMNLVVQKSNLKILLRKSLNYLFQNWSKTLPNKKSKIKARKYPSREEGRKARGKPI